MIFIICFKATEYEEVVENIEPENSCNAIVVPEPLPQVQEVLPPLETVTIEPSRPPVPPQVEPPLEQMPPEQQIYYQQHRPITEVLGTGSFYFLQVGENLS